MDIDFLELAGDIIQLFKVPQWSFIISPIFDAAITMSFLPEKWGITIKPFNGSQFAIIGITSCMVLLKSLVARTFCSSQLF